MQSIKNNEITFKGSPVQLVGRRLTPGKLAADFILVTNKMEEVRLAQFKNKIKVITTLASLDTTVCELQVKEFNKRAVGFSQNVVVIVVSKDLPFAQERFCVNHEINNLIVLSDYKYSSFGINYGLLIKELNLLARAVVILDSNDMLRYVQVAKELTQHLGYIETLSRLKEVVDSEPLRDDKNLPGKCVSCESGALPLPIEVIKNYLHSMSDWKLVENKKIVKEIKFIDFKDAKYFLDLLAIIVEEQGHHPVFTLNYNKLKMTLTTHVANGLTENDFTMARIIDEVRVLT